MSQLPLAEICYFLILCSLVPLVAIPGCFAFKTFGSSAVSTWRIVRRFSHKVHKIPQERSYEPIRWQRFAIPFFVFSCASCGYPRLFRI
jgi:hypothetical protein